jgi:nicotinamide-nucleotide amidase
MNATILTIGNELLAGRTVDLNFTYMARALGAAGVRVFRHVTAGDEREAILAAVRAALLDSDLIVISGGLGPTSDDVTRDAMAELAGCPLREDPAVVARIAARMTSLGRTLETVGRRQALLPAGMAQLANPIGLAPGLWHEAGGAIVCALPGVPRELAAMVDQGLIPRLRARFPDLTAPPVVTLRTIGIPESDLAERIETDALDLSGVVLAYLPGRGGVDLRITGNDSAATAAVERVAGALAARLATAVYARGEETMEEVVGRLLRARRLVLALAESCTGGLVGARVTRVPGSSDYFAGGVVTYANAAKEALLGVPGALLAAHGAVSGEVAGAMAEGVRARFSAHLGLAVTGIAGPGGGTPEKPVGLVFIALAGSPPGPTAVRRHLLLGDRQQVRERAATYALDLVRHALLAPAS